MLSESMFLQYVYSVQYASVLWLQDTACMCTLYSMCLRYVYSMYVYSMHVSNMFSLQYVCTVCTVCMYTMCLEYSMHVYNVNCTSLQYSECVQYEFYTCEALWDVRLPVLFVAFSSTLNSSLDLKIPHHI